MNPVEFARTPFDESIHMCICPIYGEQSSHILFGCLVVTICPPRTYNVQVKNTIALENERITTFLERLQVPEDEISGISPLLIKQRSYK